MRLIKWDKSYSVASGDIDEDHKHLMAIVNDLYGAMASGADQATNLEIMSELMDYAQDHFHREERMMAACGYAGAAEHKQVHDRLIANLAQVIEDYRSGGLPLSLSMVVALKTWLLDHMTESDRALAPSLGTVKTSRSPAAA